MIAVILHEPYLLTVINRIDISNNAIENLKNYLKQIFNGITETLWDKTSLLKIYSFLDRYEFCTVDFLNLVLNYVQDEKIPINYLTYFLYKNFIDRESIHQDRIDRAFRTLIYISVRELFKASPIRSYQYQSFRQLFNILEITPDPEEIIFSLASIKVCEIFKNEETENGHECLDSHIENLINEVDKSDKRNADLHEWSDNIHPKITEILKYMMAFKDFLATFKPGIFKKIFTERDEDSLIKVRNELDEYFSDNQKFLESNSIYLIRKLEFIKVDIMSVESDVFRFFFDFMCNFKAIWVEQLNEFIEKRNTNNVSFVCDLLMGEEIAIPFFIVGIHKSMLKNVYSLFFDNIKKHVLKNKIIKYYFLCENNYIRLCVEQNQAFDRNTPGGYGIKRISDILSFYEGKFEVITDENNAEFTRFEISLPILNNKYGKISSYHN